MEYVLSLKAHEKWRGKNTESLSPVRRQLARCQLFFVIFSSDEKLAPEKTLQRSTKKYYSCCMHMFGQNASKTETKGSHSLSQLRFVARGRLAYCVEYDVIVATIKKHLSSFGQKKMCILVWSNPFRQWKRRPQVRFKRELDISSNGRYWMKKDTYLPESTSWISHPLDFSVLNW